MKKLLASLIALLAVAFTAVSVTSCEMKYDEDYPALVEYYVCHGDSNSWYAQTSDNKMTYDSASGTYTFELETTSKNVRFEITKGASYAIEYMYYTKATATYFQDEANHEVFSKYQDNGYGSLQTVLPKAGTYIITWNPVTEKYTVAESE